MDSYKLTLSGIAEITERVEKYLNENGAKRKNAIKTKLTVEEALLKFHDHFEEGTEVLYNEYRLLGQLRVSLYIAGNAFNPFEIAESPNDILMDSLLSSYNNGAPSWKFKNFVNQMTFTAFRERKTTLKSKLVWSILIGLILGLIGRFLPGSIGAVIANDYIVPLSDAFTGLLCVMAVLLTFLAIALSIVHAGDLSTLNTIGKTMLGRFFRIMGLTALLINVMFIPFLTISDLTLKRFSLKSVYDILIGFIPSNPITPFVEFNTAQIIIIGIMFGVVMLILSNKTKTLEYVFSECNVVAISCNGFLNNMLIHIYVGMNIFTLVCTQELSSFLNYLWIILIILGAYAVLMVVVTLITARRLDWKIMDLIRKLSPTFMINLSSANFGASATTSINALLNAGMDVDYASLGHSIGGLLYKPAYVILLSAGTILSARYVNVEFNLGYLIMILILSIVLSMSLPTIPGAAISGFTLLFRQLGLPHSALAVLLTINALLDFFTVAVNGYCLQTEMLVSAHKAGKLKKGEC